MTAYELISYHAQIGQTLNAQLANWLAILSVYLGAGYLVGHRLSLSSAIAVSAVAIFWLFGLAEVISSTTQSFVGVSGEIQKLEQRGEGLEWHQAATVPVFTQEWGPTVSLIMLLVVMFMSVYFFFSSRRQNLKVAASTQ